MKNKLQNISSKWIVLLPLLTILAFASFITVSKAVKPNNIDSNIACAGGGCVILTAAGSENKISAKAYIVPSVVTYVNLSVDGVNYGGMMADNEWHDYSVSAGQRTIKAEVPTKGVSTHVTIMVPGATVSGQTSPPPPTVKEEITKLTFADNELSSLTIIKGVANVTVRAKIQDNKPLVGNFKFKFKSGGEKFGIINNEEYSSSDEAKFNGNGEYTFSVLTWEPGNYQFQIKTSKGERWSDVMILTVNQVSTSPAPSPASPAAVAPTVKEEITKLTFADNELSSLTIIKGVANVTVRAKIQDNKPLVGNFKFKFKSGGEKFGIINNEEYSSSDEAKFNGNGEYTFSVLTWEPGNYQFQIKTSKGERWSDVMILTVNQVSTSPAPSPTTKQLRVFITGNGTVDMAKPGGGKDTCVSSSCDFFYTTDSTVSLQAKPASGSIFDGWTGANCSGIGGCAIKMNAEKTVTAAFKSSPSPTTPPTTVIVPALTWLSFQDKNGDWKDYKSTCPAEGSVFLFTHSSLPDSPIQLTFSGKADVSFNDAPTAAGITKGYIYQDAFEFSSGKKEIKVSGLPAGPYKFNIRGGKGKETNTWTKFVTLSVASTCGTTPSSATTPPSQSTALSGRLILFTGTSNNCTPGYTIFTGDGRPKITVYANLISSDKLYNCTNGAPYNGEVQLEAIMSPKEMAEKNWTDAGKISFVNGLYSFETKDLDKGTSWFRIRRNGNDKWSDVFQLRIFSEK